VTRLFPILLSIALAGNARGAVVDPAPQRGRKAAAISWIDENGRARAFSQFSGYPVILLPIYTRCRGACVQNVNQLKAALAASSADPRQFRVLLFSFDDTDRPAILTRYRERENIPLGWSIGTASGPDIDALLDSIGFQVGRAGAEFIHPNLLVFLDSKLRVAKWIYGTGYSSHDVDLALNVASGGSDWIGQYSEWFYALLLFAGSILCVVLCYYFMQLKMLQRSHRRETESGGDPF
jgi:cytochrome oxidase Cu insertion factor (SCO1/SenC/PrrC family)